MNTRRRWAGPRGKTMHEEHTLHVDGTDYRTRLSVKYLRRPQTAAATAREVRAAIPGVVWEIHVQPGAQVKAGESLITMEAMKMLNPLIARQSGTIARIHVQVGDRVAKNHLLLEFL
jgi:biotin carboxyl carrier protein